MQKMSTRLGAFVLLGMMLLHASGCMNYAVWQNERRNISNRTRYNEAVSRKMVEHVPIGTWLYQQPGYSKKSFPTMVWLTLGGDGQFDRLSQIREYIGMDCWHHDSGLWENEGGYAVLLRYVDHTNKTETVNLTAKTNLFVEFDRQVREGIQPGGRGYGSPAAGSPSPHR